MANIGTITIPVRLQITTEVDGQVSGRIVPGDPVPAGNRNVSIQHVAAGMIGLSLDEFAKAPADVQKAHRDLAHNLMQLFVVTPR